MEASPTLKEMLTAARKLLYIEKQPEAALAVLAPGLEGALILTPMDKRQVFELAGRAYQRHHQFDKSSEAYGAIGDYYQAGYSQMLKGDAESAGKLWQPLLKMRENHWALWLYGLVTNTLKALPTYLQIRNHLEADMGNLLWAKQTAMTESVLCYIDFLAEVNYEAYKYVGRAFLNAETYTHVEEYLLKGQRVLPNDPEVYFHMAEYFYNTSQYEQAAILLRQCLQMCPFYTPAKVLQEKLAFCV